MASKRTQKGNLKVRRGSTGLGLFTTVPIQKGAFVIEYTGEKITNEEADRRGGKYLFELDDKWTIDGKERGNIARYINHSCDPNCETEVEGERIFVYAIRDIAAGEELAYDYGDEYYNDIIKPIGCRCGAKKHKR